MKYNIILLAAGFSRRFGGNKLLFELDGKPIYMYALQKLYTLSEREDVESAVVVTQYKEIASVAKALGIPCGVNARSDLGITSSLKLGIRVADEERQTDEDHAYVFMVADQPYMRIETLNALLDEYKKAETGIMCAASPSGRSGNPVIFAGKYREELMLLEGDKGGSQIMKRHPESVCKFNVSEEELKDIDTRDDTK